MPQRPIQVIYDFTGRITAIGYPGVVGTPWASTMLVLTEYPDDLLRTFASGKYRVVDATLMETPNWIPPPNPPPA